MPGSGDQDPFVEKLEKKARRAYAADHAPASDVGQASAMEAADEPGDGFAAWWRLVPKDYGWLCLVPLALAGTPLGWPGAVEGVALLGGLLALVGAVAFMRFRGFLERLPFRVTGWEKLVVDGDRETWRPLAIQVVTESTAKPAPAERREAHKGHAYRPMPAPEPESQVDRAVAASLTLFATRVNRKRFYEPGMTDRRERWSAIGCRASGSANPRVVWDAYRYLTRDLQAISRRLSGIRAVHLQAGEESFLVSPRGGSGADN